MLNFLVAVAAVGAGWVLGALGTRRALEEQIDRRVGELEQRLRAAAAPPPPAPPPPAQPVVEAAAPAPIEEEVPAEVIAVISAAICSFLGKPARIKRVRRVGAGLNPWAQQGRVNVMASHVLTRH